MGHVDLGPQGARAIGKFSGAHSPKKVQVLIDGAIAIRAFFAWFRQGATVFSDLFRAQVAHKGLAGPDELNCPLIELVEVVGGVKDPIFPIKTQPANIVDNGINVLGFFLGGIRIVKAQIGLAAKLRGQAKVQADGFSMSNVEITIGFGWKAGMDASCELIGFEVFADDLANEIRGSDRSCLRGHDV